MAKTHSSQNFHVQSKVKQATTVDVSIKQITLNHRAIDHGNVQFLGDICSDCKPTCMEFNKVDTITKTNNIGP
jgi:hypothetical protein